MAKKIVRGITDIKTISKQDFDTNNVNDLLSDGEHNYIHRKKGKDEEYHNLTDNIKTISSDNTDLIEVDNNNTTNNTATLKPKHDAQKEQVLESERNTITINHGSNGTPEKTKVDTNPQKVLEHDKLKTGDGLATLFNTDETTIIFKPKALQEAPAKNGLYYGDVTKDGAPYATISLNHDNDKYVQIGFRESVNNSGRIVGKYRFMNNNTPTEWKELLIDDATIKGFLAQKQNTLTSNTSIGVLSNNTLRQLYTSNHYYTHENGNLITHTKLLALNTNVETPKEEYNFTLKINQGQQSATFTLNTHDKDKFNRIITKYGVDSSVRINGCLFSLSGTTLTVTTEVNTENNYVITFSDII